MTKVRLIPFLRDDLDVLFVGLNPSVESNDNGHYFSGKWSRFFHLLYLSGLITCEVDKSAADEIVFGTNEVNYNNAQFGVVDLVPEVVESNSAMVKPKDHDVQKLLSTIRRFEPRFVCVIHAKAQGTINRLKASEIIGKIELGSFNNILRDCKSTFIFNYFPNGNNKPDVLKLRIFRQLRDVL